MFKVNFQMDELKSLIKSLIEEIIIAKQGEIVVKNEDEDEDEIVEKDVEDEIVEDEIVEDEDEIVEIVKCYSIKFDKSIDCDCGSNFNQKNIQRHFRSGKHIKWLENL